MPRPLVATIDIKAMQSNLNLARQHAPDSKMWAVVKANAYGHGLKNALLGFAQADGMALIEIEGAAQLRALGWHGPLLLLEGVFDASDLYAALQHRCSIVVHCEEQIRMLELTPLADPLDIYLKLNSGMNRLGFRPDDFPSVLKRLRESASVGRISFMTHFANADQDEDAVANLSAMSSTPLLRVEDQLRLFKKLTTDLSGECSIANSAADLMRPEAVAGWVRPGIMLYGGSPGAIAAEQYGLRPAMTLSSRLIGIQQIAAGESVGYGSRYVAQRPMRIGVVACGYADGYPRSAPDGTPVLVNGVRATVAGRISMDMITVDLSAVPDAGVGSDVVLWGRGLPIDEVAQCAGTIGYELMCALTARVPVVAATDPKA